MEVQGASQTLRDAVGYRSRRFLRRQRETRQVKISQVFFGIFMRTEKPKVAASNPFLEPCLQRYAPLTRELLEPRCNLRLHTKMRGLANAFRGNRTAYLS